MTLAGDTLPSHSPDKLQRHLLLLENANAEKRKKTMILTQKTNIWKAKLIFVIFQFLFNLNTMRKRSHTNSIQFVGIVFNKCEPKSIFFVRGRNEIYVAMI